MTDDELRAWMDKRLERSKNSPRLIVKETKVRFERPEASDTEQWRTKALADLRNWMLASSQPAVTIETWAAVYIRCGRCVKEWRQWCEDNPIGDLASWIDAASEVVAAKRWI